MTNRTILTHAVFIGLTPLIPIPFLDDLVKSFFYRSLIQSLANGAGLKLTDAEIAALAEERSTGCLYGCTFGLLEYLVKRLVRKVIFILEWRRAIDLVTHTYYVGRLLAHAFAQGWYTPGDPAAAARLRAAVEKARAGANTNLVKRIVAASLRQSQHSIIGAVRILTGSLQGLAALFPRRRRKRSAETARAESAVEDTLERETPRVRATVGDLIEQLQLNLASVPEGHFEQLEARLAEALAPAPTGSPAAQ